LLQETVILAERAAGAGLTEWDGFPMMKKRRLSAVVSRSLSIYADNNAVLAND
jgi:hypothetical protein